MVVLSRSGRIAMAIAALVTTTLPAAAQVKRDSATVWLMNAGGEGERYLRVLQLAGFGAATQWSLRPFSSAMIGRITGDTAGTPWASSFRRADDSRPAIHFVAPEFGGIVNSTFPYGFNDGPIWAGRGLTLSAAGGVAGHAGPLRFVLAPQVFIAQNAGFPLAPNGRTGAQAFGDASDPIIDYPQRFGDGAYGRVDPGQSVVQLTALHLTVGASTANEYWGPAAESPFLLGNNAAGFVHVFAGTDGPVSLGPLQLNARMIAGRLDQSKYSTASPGAERRYISGLVVAASLRQLPGLEVGGGRLFENIWPDTGFSVGDIVAPLFQSLLKNRLDARFGNRGTKPDNQLASLFARWAFPASGFELYGEYGREDNAWDTRDLIVEPDHDVAFLIGLSRVWKRPGSRLLVLRGELLNSAITDLRRVRPQAPPYVHSPVVQGHTQLGQILGAPAGYAGGGSSVALDWYSPRGRTTFTWRRMMREPALVPSDAHDVMHSVSIDGLLFRRRIDLAPELTLVYNANRNGGGDAFNARVALAARAHW